MLTRSTEMSTRLERERAYRQLQLQRGLSQSEIEAEEKSYKAFCLIVDRVFVFAFWGLCDAGAVDADEP